MVTGEREFAEAPLPAFTQLRAMPRENVGRRRIVSFLGEPPVAERAAPVEP